MTDALARERVLPAIALPAPAAPRPLKAPAIVRPATQRREAFMTQPARAAMLLGSSAAVYAIALAAVAALQSGTDAELAARRGPYLESVAAARAANDALAGSLAALDADARSVADRYAGVSSAIAEQEASLDELAALVGRVQGTANALPTRISLPSVTVRSTSRQAAAPRTTATTGASGG